MAKRTHDQNTLLHGSWNALCDVCGFKFKARDLKKRWDGAYVCKDDWEPRHPSDLYRPPIEDPSVPWTRPDPDTSDIIYLVDSNGSYLIDSENQNDALLIETGT